MHACLSSISYTFRPAAVLEFRHPLFHHPELSPTPLKESLPGRAVTMQPQGGDMKDKIPDGTAVNGYGNLLGDI